MNIYELSPSKFLIWSLSSLSSMTDHGKSSSIGPWRWAQPGSWVTCFHVFMLSSLIRLPDPHLRRKSIVMDRRIMENCGTPVIDALRNWFRAPGWSLHLAHSLKIRLRGLDLEDERGMVRRDPPGGSRSGVYSRIHGTCVFLVSYQ